MVFLRTRSKKAPTLTYAADPAKLVTEGEQGGQFHIREEASFPGSPDCKVNWKTVVGLLVGADKPCFSELQSGIGQLVPNGHLRRRLK